jgi:hypothetical protein
MNKQISNGQKTIALGTVAIAAIITLFATGPLVVTHQAQAFFGGETNPSTGNPHPSGEPTGNPHQGPCSGNPHGQSSSGFGQRCNGAQ